MGHPAAIPWTCGLAAPGVSHQPPHRDGHGRANRQPHDQRCVAQIRSALSGGDGRRPLRADQLAQTTRAARRRTEELDIERRWSDWFNEGPPQRMEAVVKDWKSQGHTKDTLIERALGQAPRPVEAKRWKKAARSIQATAAKILRRKQWLRAGPKTLRKKLGGWNADVLPGHRVQRSVEAMRRLPRKTPPRIKAAVLRSWLDGWCTKRRFGSRGSKCMFGCEHGEDALSHYTRCSKVWGFGCKHLHLDVPETPSGRTTAAMLWERGCPKKRLIDLATMMAVAYRAHNKLRHWHGTTVNAEKILKLVWQDLTTKADDEDAH